MKIIDFERKGNAVRFWLGDDDCNDYWGDDWDDVPYESNAGRVYGEFVVNNLDICAPFDWLVLEPCDGLSYSKEDMIHRRVPCIVLVPDDVVQGNWHSEFSYWASADGVKKIYFGDDPEDVLHFLSLHSRPYGV